MCCVWSCSSKQIWCVLNELVSARAPSLRYTDGGPLLLCAECSTGLHTQRVFRYHKLVKISRKVSSD